MRAWPGAPRPHGVVPVHCQNTCNNAAVLSRGHWLALCCLLPRINPAPLPALWSWPCPQVYPAVPATQAHLLLSALARGWSRGTCRRAASCREWGSPC
jgi:hypothetical protein